MVFFGFGVCTGRRDLSSGFQRRMCAQRKEQASRCRRPTWLKGRHVCLALRLPILAAGFLSCPAAFQPPFQPLLSSLALSLPQRFLQALEPEEVTSYFGPDATLGGTCPRLFLARGVSLRFISPWNQGPGILVALLGRGQDGCHPCSLTLLLPAKLIKIDLGVLDRAGL